MELEENSSPSLASFSKLKKTVISCRLCPRLVQFREQVPARKIFSEQSYWRKPIPGFGDHKAWLLILGLAPSPDGGNRTGRIFTGDNSARFLFKALFEEGFANQPTSEFKEDGLILHGCYITAIVKCVPPQHRPTSQECLNCSRYWHAEMQLLKKVKAVLTLGEFAFNALRSFAKESGKDVTQMKFSHGKKYPIDDFPIVYASFHPSPQNTNTGILTHQMFTNLLKQIKLDYNKNVGFST